MMQKRIYSCILILAALIGQLNGSAQQGPGKIWTKEKANQWYDAHPWLTGANYIPSNAINQLEMWQAATFSPDLIDKELALAQGIGFNTMRVFLHHLAWEADKPGFKDRINKFLAIAEKHGIQPLFVFFDDCWNKEGRIGKQPDPKPGVHNSGWVQDPGQPASEDTTIFPGLEKYVKDILTSFGHDKRILGWDLYNEPGNSNKGDKSLPLLTAVFKWAREANPEQPVTSGIWRWDLENLNAFQVTNSDIVSYHDYSAPEKHIIIIQMLKCFGKPLICTEYMSRSSNSRFVNVLPLLKKEKVAAINWGFVQGKTNTIYAWDTPIADGSEPNEWFHDIFRKDFTPYRRDETDLIKKLNAQK